MMGLDQIASRMEELSLELDCEELQGLANALSSVEAAKCPTCEESQRYKSLVESIANVIGRSGIRINNDYRDMMGRERMMEQVYRHAAASMPMTNPVRLTDVFKGSVP